MRNLEKNFSPMLKKKDRPNLRQLAISLPQPVEILKKEPRNRPKRSRKMPRKEKEARSRLALKLTNGRSLPTQEQLGPIVALSSRWPLQEKVKNSLNKKLQSTSKTETLQTNQMAFCTN